MAAIDAARNRIVLAPKEAVFHRGARCRSLRMRTRALDGPLAAKTRYRRSFSPVSEAALSRGVLEVRFVEPQWAVAPGQSLVLYRDGVVVGGGVIEEGIAER